MKRRSLILAVAAALAVSSVSFGALGSADAADSIISFGFDSTTDGWQGRGSASVSVDTDSYYEGGGSLKVTGRQDNWNGASISLPAASFTAGQSYSFSAAVLQKSGDPVQIKMTLQYGSGAQESYSEIALVTVQSGVWTDVFNSTYTLPAGADSMTLYLESPDSLTDFCIDSFTAAASGTPSAITTGKGVVDGAGSTKPANAILGDFNYSGKVDVFDLVLAREAMAGRFSGSITVDLDVADIDDDGDFSMNDLVLLAKFLHGQLKAFPERTVRTTTAPPVTTAPTTTTATGQVISGDYMQQIANDMQISAPGGFTQKQAGVDYGTIVDKEYFSTVGNINKKVKILLPAGYNTNEKYPVLYVLHGIFGDETSMIGMGVPTMVGNLIAEGKAEKMIVVFPAMFTGSGSPGFTADAAHKYDLIREDIEECIMPLMEENFSVKTGRENTAITGFSMGGREALYTGVTRSEVYGYVGGACPAPGIFATRDNFMEHVGVMAPSEFKPSTMPYMLLISAAANDGTVGTYPQTYHEALESNGAEHLWQIIPDGDHGNRTVDPHMYNFLRYIFKAA